MIFINYDIMTDLIYYYLVRADKLSKQWFLTEFGDKIMRDIQHLSEKHFKWIFIAYLKSDIASNEHLDVFRIAFTSQAKDFSIPYIVDCLILLTK